MRFVSRTPIPTSNEIFKNNERKQIQRDPIGTSSGCRQIKGFLVGLVSKFRILQWHSINLES